jgi:hypothetical protein
VLFRYPVQCCGSALFSRFQSGSSFLSQCGSGSSFLSRCVYGSREPNQCGFMRIRILVGFKVIKSRIFTRYILKAGNRLKSIPSKVQKPFQYAGNKVCKILVNVLAPGSGSAFPLGVRIQDSQMNADPDPQHWFCTVLLCTTICDGGKTCVDIDKKTDSSWFSKIFLRSIMGYGVLKLAGQSTSSVKKSNCFICQESTTKWVTD